jgi:hypothetical protein
VLLLQGGLLSHSNQGKYRHSITTKPRPRAYLPPLLLLNPRLHDVQAVTVPANTTKQYVISRAVPPYYPTLQ